MEDTKLTREHSIKRSFCNRKAFYTNCWHMEDYDAASMWPIYAPGGEGIAITSNYERLKQSITFTEERIHIGTISYKDYKLKNIGGHNGFRSCVHKRESFSFEKELRMVIWDKHMTHIVENSYITRLRKSKDIRKLKVPPGKNVKCDLATLIDEIYVSPTAAAWFFDLAQNVICKYGISRNIKRSDLSSNPPR